MIAVDTNVLLRRVLDDDVEQAAKARKLFDGTAPILVTDIVLVEAIWTLKGKRYRASKDDIVVLVTKLLEEPNVVFESERAIWSALNEFIEAPLVKCPDGMRHADFSDALIVAKAMDAMDRWAVPYDATYTFDVAAQSLHGTKSLDEPAP
ncbi:type II toxin-antitoxin system VapC family toxin [Robbsia sp. Bb-Pol-6]|uniref:Type II toxin-antitoxin system VapC family toxin n=1 Tax=Robbsia betulipollinis TaxID=2981849 RepID=A0ABT3ZSL0_9BURK|nr:type II toxin-antitoxin system VapC family toxin [Robbsia betulipollinis]MCY0389267.1 type II toxin-antitoxin system VapC family toxin [Robbsia betulipollinis]